MDNNYGNCILCIIKLPRKKMKNKIDRKEIIFEAALHCFNKDGYYKTSMDKIAKRAKITKCGIYYHFKSKDDLFIKLFLNRGERFFESASEFIQGINDPEKRIKKFVSKAGTIFNDNEDFLKFSIEFMAMGARKPKVRQVMNAYYRDSIKNFGGFLKDGIDANKFKKIDVEKIARIYYLLCMGALFTYFSLDADYKLVDQHLYNVKYIMNSIRKN